MCAHEDWVGSNRGQNKLKCERMKVLSRVNSAMNVSHEKLKESLVRTSLLAHDSKPRQAREAGGPSGI